MASKLLFQPMENQPDGCIHQLTPATAGWEYVGFEVYMLKKDTVFKQETGDTEVCLLIIGGRATVATRSELFKDIGDRESPFENHKPGYSVYIPPRETLTVTALTDLEVTLSKAPAAGKYGVKLIEPSSLQPVHRGHGYNKRTVYNVLAEESSSERLLVFEVMTDEPNTSSWPSHKHDTQNPPYETYYEETSYHRINPSQGFSFQRVYTDDRSLDECIAAYNRDLVIVPKGYHPVSTIAGYNNYYLNAMAGPEKLWRYTFENDHKWILQGDDFR